MEATNQRILAPFGLILVRRQYAIPLYRPIMVMQPSKSAYPSFFRCAALI